MPLSPRQSAKERMERMEKVEKPAMTDEAAAAAEPATPEEDLEEPLLGSGHSSPKQEDLSSSVVETATVTATATIVTPEEEQPEVSRPRLLWPLLPSPSPSSTSPANANDNATRRQPQRQRQRPLAWMRSTPLLVKICMPLFIVSCHAIFYYGQTANMWRLTGSWKADLHYKVVAVETKTAFQTLKIDTMGSYVVDSQKDLRVFTYAFAIQELWKAKGMPGVFIPRLAAVGLIVFSGFWPHLKLLLLLLTWWCVSSPVRRRRLLTCLSLFGKWSLVDVLTVVVMVGVLNLDWHFTAESLKMGVLDHLPNLLAILRSIYTNDQICERALGYSCVDPKNLVHIAECKICKTTSSQLLEHATYTRRLLEGIEVTGSGQGQMAVSGLKGIYAFCAAVILSICLSFIVDYCDLIFRRSQQQQTNEELRSDSPEVSGTLLAAESSHYDDDRMTTTLSLSSNVTTTATTTTTATATTEPLLNRAERGDVRSNADREYDRRILLERQQFSNTIWESVAWITALVVGPASALISMERRVEGALPSLLKSVLGIEWRKQYSFWSLGWVTSKAGGWDFMLMLTFVWFIIVGPLVRSLLAIRASRQVERPEMTPHQAAVVQRRRERLTTWIDFVGAFCAWEVFSISALMVNLLMPSITNTIIMDKRCQMLVLDNEQCMEVHSEMTWVFALVIAGYCLLALVSWRARTYKPATASLASS